MPELVSTSQAGSQPDGQSNTWDRLEEAPQGISFESYVVHPTNHHLCKVYGSAEKRWFRMATTVLRGICVACGVGFSPVPGQRVRAPEGHKNGAATVTPPPSPAAEPSLLEDLTGKEWAGDYKHPAPSHMQIPGSDSEIYQFGLVSMARPKMRRLRYGGETTNCVLFSILNAADCEALLSAGLSTFLSASAKALAATEGRVAISATMEDATHIVNRTGVLQLQRLPASSRSFGDATRMLDPERLMEAMCDIAMTWWGEDLGLGVAVVRCTVLNGDLPALAIHRIVVDLNRALFCCPAEEQTYPLIKSVLVEKGILGFSDPRFFHRTLGDWAECAEDASLRKRYMKAHKRRSLWEEQAAGGSEGAAAVECDEPILKKKGGVSQGVRSE